jgi:serine/threonine protein kinase
MTTTLACPDETEMLAVAMGEPVAAAMTAHVDGCVMCRARLDRLKAELASLRQNHGYAPTPPDPFDPESVAEARECAQEKGRWPDAIGKYKVVGWIDGGGEADVFRVVHINLGNDLVLKLSRIEVAADMQSGLVAVGQMLIDLQHPNLVRIFDLDFHDDRPFLVMEYVRGCNLEQHAGAEAVTPRRAAELVAKLAEVMAVAHQHGITHCDIKPKNVLIDKLGEPRLIDFGMARLRHAWADRPPSSCGGTVAYMAPEQARLEFDRIGPRSDIFALGGVLYFLLTGQAPFGGKTLEEAWDRARRCDFKAGALRAAKVPRRLERICLKAMSAEPDDRYATAEALQRALKRYLAWPKMLAAAVVPCGVGLLAGVLYSFVPPVPTPTPSPVITKPLKGRIDLLVVKSKDGTRRRLRLEDRGSVPTRAGDEIRIESRLDRPAYVYLFWIGSEGKVAPLYPWKDHDWSTRPAEERKVKAAELPEIVDKVWEIPASPPGLETLVLLVREDSPLPREAEAKLAQDLSGAPVPLPADINKATWIEDGEEVIFEPTVGPRRDRAGYEALSRGIPNPKARPSDDPVLRIRALLRDKVQPLGSYSQAVLFPNQGG